MAQEEGNKAYADYAGARVLVTGGLGLIGSALARRLLELGSNVVVLDSSLPGSGANPFNLQDLQDRIDILHGDIRDADALKRCVPNCKYIFNLAGQISHQASMTEPLLDFDINCRAQLGLLEVCRALNPSVNIVFASTRQLYGRPDYLPVDEKHPVRPVDVNGISKWAGEAFYVLYHQVYGIRCCSLRLTNTYGPRMRIADARQTFVGVWIKAAIENQPIQVWGGEQLRDFTYVDDAVDAFLTAALNPATAGRAFNIAGHGAVSLRRLAELVVGSNGGGSFEIKEFPAERKKIDIGDYYGDDSAFRSVTGWAPRVDLGEGLRRSLAYYRENFPHYVGVAS